MIIISTYILLFCLPFVDLYINKHQWTTINSFLKKKNFTTIEQKEQINKIIYSHYEKWAFYKASQFKQFHYYKCKEIRQQELNLYASIGLIKSIQNYDPCKCENTTFSIYSLNYVIGELYNGMTILQPMSILTKTERKKSYNKRIDNTKYTTTLVGDDNYLFDSNPILFDKNNYNNNLYDNNLYDNNLYNSCEELWTTIESMKIPHLTKTIINLKYSFDFEKTISNKDISIMLGYSEETIRQHVNQFKNCFKENCVK